MQDRGDYTQSYPPCKITATSPGPAAICKYWWAAQSNEVSLHTRVCVWPAGHDHRMDRLAELPQLAICCWEWLTCGQATGCTYVQYILWRMFRSLLLPITPQGRTELMVYRPCLSCDQAAQWPIPRISASISKCGRAVLFFALSFCPRLQQPAKSWSISGQETGTSFTSGVPNNTPFTLTSQARSDILYTGQS